MSNLQIIRTDSNNSSFRSLVQLLDKELAVIDGDDHAFYDQYNKIDTIKHAVVAFQNEQPVGCGAYKEIMRETVEVKRMYVLESHRSKGIASAVLSELEQWAKELGYKKCLLETGKRQQDAIALYTRNDYKVIPNYGQYTGVDNSVCFEKIL